MTQPTFWGVNDLQRLSDRQRSRPESLTFRVSRIKRQLSPTSECPCAAEMVAEWLI
jgi:hypothetical protein